MAGGWRSYIFPREYLTSTFNGITFPAQDGRTPLAGVLEVVRENVSSIAPTMGEMLVEGEHLCYTLEDPWLNNEVDKSCIPVGTYGIVLTLSTRFGGEMPRLIGVPGRLGILIHPGNTDLDTTGCILVVDKRLGEDLLNSRRAFEGFLTWFASVGNEASVVISVSTSAPPPNGETF